MAALMNGVFNTLAQSGTGKKQKAPVSVSGNGSDITTDKVKHGRAKRKTISQSMVLGLIDLVKDKNQDSQQYWNTYHCQGEIITSNGKSYGRYCKNRCCTLCSSIRKAKLINNYSSVLAKWESPYFVTLTIKAVRADRLEYMLKEGIIRAFRLITEKYRKRNQRNKSVKLMGIRSLECNFNPDKKTYNPHLHLIVPDKQTAEILIKEWLNLWTRKFTIRSAQDMQPIKDKVGSLIEIIKYGSKIFTEPDVNKKSRLKSDERQIYLAALENIFQAMKGHRIFERFGFNLPKSDKAITKDVSLLTDYQEWKFSPQLADWINKESGESFSGYKLTPELKKLLEYGIDTENS